jgi:short-subunit dehydrogenase
VSVTVLCPTFFPTNIHNSMRGATEKTRAFVDKMMKRSSLKASDVARFALERVAASDLYAVPHADGRWLWRLKRTLPSAYSAIVARLAARGVFDA